MIKLDIKRIWTFALITYIVCNAAFSYGNLKMLNTWALYFFLVVSIVNMFIKRHIRLELNIITSVCLLGVMIIGSMYTPASKSVINTTIYDYFTMAVIVLCVCQYIEKIEDIEHIVFAYMIAGLVLAVYVYAQYGNEFWNILQENTSVSVNSVNRMDGDLANANIISMYTAFSAIIGVYYLLLTKQSKIKKTFCVLSIAFCFIVSMAAASKKTLLIIFVCLIAMYFYSKTGNRNILKKIRNLVLLTVGIVGILYLIMKLPVFSGIASRYNALFAFLSGETGTSSEEKRFEMILRGFQLWCEAPIFGKGTAATVYYFGVYSHNNYIEMLANHGLVGLVLFYAPYIPICYNYISNAKDYRVHYPISIVLIAIFCSLVLCGMAFVYYYERYFMILLASIFSSVKVMNNRENNITNKLDRIA